MTCTVESVPRGNKKIIFTDANNLFKIIEYFIFIGEWSPELFYGDPRFVSITDLNLRGYWWFHPELESSVKEAIEILWPDQQ